MTNNYLDPKAKLDTTKAELKARRRAEAERIWFSDEASDEELQEVYRSLDIKEPN